MKPFLILVICTVQQICPAQVMWQFKSEPIVGNETTVHLAAQIAPGWHIYSQFMEPGGPPPTRIAFDGGVDLLRVGKAEETGTPIKFHDENFDTDITWYLDAVAFVQRLRLLQQVPSVSVRIDYMVCNEHQCIPFKKEFNIELTPLRKSP